MLRFAIGPVHLDEEGEELRERAARLLTSALGDEVRIEAHPSYPALESAVAEGRTDLAWLSPAVYVRLRERADVALLAAVARGEGHNYRGVIFVKKESSARTPADLQGKRIAWVDRDSCAGHLFPALALRAKGLDPAKLFREQTFAGSHAEVVRRVMRGEADAGATYVQPTPDGERILVAAWAAWCGADAMRALSISDAIPADVIVARPGLAGIDVLKAKLLSVHETRGAPDLLDELFGGPRLRAALESDYEPVRAALR